MNREENHLLELALETLPNFILTDQQGIIVYMNQVYADLLGRPLSGIIGHPVTEIIPGTRMMQILTSGKPEIGDVMNLYDHSKGKNISVICNRLPIIENGKVIGAAAMTTFESMDEINGLYAELDRIKAENKKMREKILRQQNNPLKKIIGTSPEIMDIKQTISDFADSNLTILLTGETGTGKEVFAKAIHELSSRSKYNYVKINCAAIPKDLLESELFGYEEGAFTGARKSGKPGKFELADHGTLLLDEIGEMPLSLQAKLLRVLQEKEIERLGSSRPKKIDVRVICSTNVNIRDKVRSGDFREDLYYRINTIELSIPPLRDRPNDIPALCFHFIKKSNDENSMHVQGISDEVLELFQTYSWPGNVRELEHTIERLSFQNQNKIIEKNSCGFLIHKIQSASDPRQTDTAVRPADPHARPMDLVGNSSPTGADSLISRREMSEAMAIKEALRESGGNKSKAAKILGISRSMLYVKLKKYGINFPA